jgi:hypothetical protein
MRYFLDWRDYVKQPHIKQLIESKGLEHVRQEYIRESNRVMWNDPVIITETATPGLSVASSNNSYGSSTQFITGYSTEVSTLTFATGLNPGISGALHGTYFEIAAYNNEPDYTLYHSNAMKLFRCYISTGSGTTFNNTAGLNGVITASSVTADGNVSGSLLNAFRDAINNQLATATVGGYTNTIAPKTLFSASVSNVTLTVTRTYKAAVSNISLVAGPNTINLTATASVATPTDGLDTFYFSPGSQTFDGTTLPYATLPRR